MDFPIPPEFWWSTDILLIINPSTPPSRFPSTLEISLGLRPREISQVSGNGLGVGDGFPNTSLVLVEHGYKDITNDISICQTGKYKNAGTQIHKYRAYNEVTEKNMWHIFETVVQ